MKKTKNKGEWSELYALLRIIDDQNLYAGDDNFKKNLDTFFPVLEVFNGDDLNFIRYQLDLKNKNVNVYVNNSLDSISIPIDQFSTYSNLLLGIIKNSKGRSFEASAIESFISQISLSRIASSSSNKVDIQAIVDPQDSNPIKLGFSIKSWLGSLPTLLNASKATHFIFKIQNSNPLTKSIVDGANNIRNFHQKFLYFREHQMKLSFSHINSQIFHNNLTLIDSQLPQILAFLVEDYYSSEKVVKVSELVSRLAKKNPLDCNNQYFYEKKIRDLLSKVALGMFPNTIWDGYNSVSGGHILVCKNGELITYLYIYFPQQFENYLFRATKFETASTSRYDFGKIYFDDPTKTHYIKLNLQIRFSTLPT
jgi:type II restriction enzyme